MSAPADRQLDPRRRAFAQAVGRAIAAAVWAEITAPEPTDATGRLAEGAARDGEQHQGEYRAADYDGAG